MLLSNLRKILLPVLWLITTVSLGVWWFFLGLKQNRFASELAGHLQTNVKAEVLEKLDRQSRMIKMEGAFFLVLLTVGGVTLVWLTFREDQRNKLIHDFFSTVTHEMKTPLASLRLQAESLLEERLDPAKDRLLVRLLKDSVRIESQMNKAMYLASLMRSEGLYLEETDLSELESSLREDWGELQIRTDWKVKRVRADRRALESVIKNLLENSLQHGSATEVKISSRMIGGNRVEFEFVDNGKGFAGDLQNLGRPFFRHTSTSGTGIGLYIIRQLLEKMNGTFSVGNSPSGGFWAQWTLPSSDTTLEGEGRES
ncbi:two-component sensor histidine kinase [Leptospira perolatii]|uniref:histidine kinase n=1 Tax=Leptospira perolatii TaxID=2023191 RepID=A0A2M9ZPG3_9LEPT|nr:HAMP domain-containing sensor histidine kinase [Leptospira perolatii]PJZ70749.1 two-component sensor histidine kinase [Leptospira perolatii]PJZ73957.1 two-component sensor histidine kinase [Leptospira perolatii]